MLKKVVSGLLGAGHLSIGMGIAQLINFISLFYLSRFASSEALSLLAFLTANLTGLAPLVSLRLDIALVVTKDSKDRRTLASASIVFSLIVSFLLLMIFASGITNFDDASQLNTQNVVVFVIALTLNNILTFGAATLNSRAAYRTMAAVLVFQSVIYLIATVLFVGLIDKQGAIIALVTSYFVAGLLYFRLARDVISWRFDRKEIMKALVKYRLYPLVSMPMAIANGYQQVLPILFIVKYFTAFEVSIFFLVQRYIGSPLSIASRAFSDVLLKEFSVLSYGPRSILFAGCFAFLAFIGGLVLTVLYLTPDKVFGLILNVDTSFKIIVIIITLPILVKFAVSPLSGILPAVGRVEYEAAWKLPAFLILFFFLNYYVDTSDFRVFLLQLAYLESALYLTYAIFCFIVSLRSKQ